MKVLIDTNIILDVLCDRKQFIETSSTVFKLCEAAKISGYVSALSIPNIVYIMSKELDDSKIREIIKSLSLIFTFSDLKADDLQKAANLNFCDYEDALQSTCASRIQADYIITRNIKDFFNSAVPAITPTELINII